MKCVTGLASAMVQCYDQGILPAEHRALAWAAGGERIDLTTTDWQLERGTKRAVPIHTDNNGNGHANGNGNGHGGNGHAAPTAAAHS
jgi:hypothetical protein